MIPILALVAAFTILAWRDLRLALILLCGLLPTYLLRLDFFVIPTTALELMVLASALVWIIKHRGLKIDLRSLGPNWLRPIFLLLASACFAVVVAPDTFSALGIWKAYFIEPVLFYLILRSTFRDQRDWQMAVGTLFISASVISLIAIIQKFTGIGIPSPWDIEYRVTSIFDFPNAVGLFLAPIVSYATVLVANRMGRYLGRSLQTIAVVTIFTGVIAIIFSQTEAALIAMPGGLLCAYLISGANKKNKTLALALSIAVGAFIFAGVPVVREKILLQDASGLARQNLWQETSELLGDHFVFGAGLAGFPTEIAPYHDYTYYEIFQYPHNIVLNIWVELGLLGLLAVIWLGLEVFKAARTEKQDVVKLAAFAALATMVIHGLVDVPYFKNDLSMLTWFFLALFAASFTQSGTNKNPHSMK